MIPPGLRPHKPSSNWFVHWDESSAEHGKCFLLQLKLENIRHLPFTSSTLSSIFSLRRQNDLPNIYTALYRRHDTSETFSCIGVTSLIHSDSNPNFPDGFHIFYDRHTDLNEDLIKLICFHRRDAPASHEYTIGSCILSLKELTRAFGARVQVELVNNANNLVAGRAWFIAEAMPITSPRGSADSFKIGLSVSGKVNEIMKRGSNKYSRGKEGMIVYVERQRDDQTWSAIYRGSTTRRHGVISNVMRKLGIGQTVSSLSPSSPSTRSKDHKTSQDDHRQQQQHTKAEFAFTPFILRKGEILLGQHERRKIRFSFFVVDRKASKHPCVGMVTMSVRRLQHWTPDDPVMDVKSVQGNTIGDFQLIRRDVENQDDDNNNGLNINVSKITRFDINVRFLDRMELEHAKSVGENNHVHEYPLRANEGQWSSSDSFVMPNPSISSHSSMYPPNGGGPQFMLSDPSKPLSATNPNNAGGLQPIEGSADMLMQMESQVLSIPTMADPAKRRRNNTGYSQQNIENRIEGNRNEVPQRSCSTDANMHGEVTSDSGKRRSEKNGFESDVTSHDHGGGVPLSIDQQLLQMANNNSLSPSRTDVGVNSPQGQGFVEVETMTRLDDVETAAIVNNQDNNRGHIIPDDSMLTVNTTTKPMKSVVERLRLENEEVSPPSTFNSFSEFCTNVESMAQITGPEMDSLTSKFRNRKTSPWTEGPSPPP